MSYTHEGVPKTPKRSLWSRLTALVVSLFLVGGTAFAAVPAQATVLDQDSFVYGYETCTTHHACDWVGSMGTPETGFFWCIEAGVLTGSFDYQMGAGTPVGGDNGKKMAYIINTWQGTLTNDYHAAISYVNHELFDSTPEWQIRRGKLAAQQPQVITLAAQMLQQSQDAIDGGWSQTPSQTYLLDQSNGEIRGIGVKDQWGNYVPGVPFSVYAATPGIVSFSSDNLVTSTYEGVTGSDAVSIPWRAISSGSAGVYVYYGTYEGDVCAMDPGIRQAVTTPCVDPWFKTPSVQRAMSFDVVAPFQPALYSDMLTAGILERGNSTADLMDVYAVGEYSWEAGVSVRVDALLYWTLAAPPAVVDGGVGTMAAIKSAVAAVPGAELIHQENFTVTGATNDHEVGTGTTATKTGHYWWVGYIDPALQAEPVRFLNNYADSVFIGRETRQAELAFQPSVTSNMVTPVKVANGESLADTWDIKATGDYSWEAGVEVITTGELYWTLNPPPAVIPGGTGAATLTDLKDAVAAVPNKTLVHTETHTSSGEEVYTAGGNLVATQSGYYWWFVYQDKQLQPSPKRIVDSYADDAFVQRELRPSTTEFAITSLVEDRFLNRGQVPTDTVTLTPNDGSSWMPTPDGAAPVVNLEGVYYGNSDNSNWVLGDSAQPGLTELTTASLTVTLPTSGLEPVTAPVSGESAVTHSTYGYWVWTMEQSNQPAQTQLILSKDQTDKFGQDSETAVTRMRLRVFSERVSEYTDPTSGKGTINEPIVGETAPVCDAIWVELEDPTKDQWLNLWGTATPVSVVVDTDLRTNDTPVGVTEPSAVGTLESPIVKSFTNTFTKAGKENQQVICHTVMGDKDQYGFYNFQSGIDKTKQLPTHTDYINLEDTYQTDNLTWDIVTQSYVTAAHVTGAWGNNGYESSTWLPNETVSVLKRDPKIKTAARLWDTTNTDAGPNTFLVDDVWQTGWPMGPEDTNRTGAVDHAQWGGLNEWAADEKELTVELWEVSSLTFTPGLTCTAPDSNSRLVASFTAGGRGALAAANTYVGHDQVSGNAFKAENDGMAYTFVIKFAGDDRVMPYTSACGEPSETKIFRTDEAGFVTQFAEVGTVTTKETAQAQKQGATITPGTVMVDNLHVWWKDQGDAKPDMSAVTARWEFYFTPLKNQSEKSIVTNVDGDLVYENMQCIDENLVTKSKESISLRKGPGAYKSPEVTMPEGYGVFGAVEIVEDTTDPANPIELHRGTCGIVSETVESVVTPKIDIEKWSTNEGWAQASKGDHDTQGDAKELNRKTDEEITFTITNNGTEPLVMVTVTDELIDGVNSIENLTCDFTPATQADHKGTTFPELRPIGLADWAPWAADGVEQDPTVPTSGTEWNGPFLVGASFDCKGTVPGLEINDFHANSAEVQGYGQYTGKPVDDKDDWWGKVTAKPSIDIEKWSTDEGWEQAALGDHDTAEDSKQLEINTPEEITFTITNTGNEPLTKIVVEDKTTDGVGTVENLTCDFVTAVDPEHAGATFPDLRAQVDQSWVPFGSTKILTWEEALATVPTTGTKWDGALPVGASFDCIGTLTGIPAESFHANNVTVVGIGEFSGTEVDDEDSWWGKTQAEPIVPAPTLPRSPDLPWTGAGSVFLYAGIGALLIGAGTALTIVRRRRTLNS